MRRFFKKVYSSTGLIKDPAQCTIASQVSAVVVEGLIVFSVLGTIGIDTSPLVAAAGISGATIGFACKDFGANFVAGVALAGQPCLRDGSRVTIGTGPSMVSGTVSNWDTRYMYLRNDKGQMVHVPNNLILNSVVTWENPDKTPPSTQELPGSEKETEKEWKAFAGKVEPIDKSGDK